MTPSPSTPEFVAYSGLIIDDIVLPDGRTFMNTLGGSATHALVGMRVWAERLGYFAAVGADFAPRHRALLEGLGIDLRGLLVREGSATARAWQLFEPDERRIEVFRTDIEDFYRIEPGLDEMPADYFAARGFHICHGTFADTLDVVTRLRAVNPTACIMWEPTPLQLSPSADEMRVLFANVDAFSPDRSEAAAITGQDTIEGAMQTLLDWGAPIVALRMGAQGSCVETASGESYRIPAIPVNVVDTTGGGDAYCGGLLVALANGEPAAEAGARAAVSASFAIEQFGVPAFGEQTRDEAERRLAWANTRIVAGSSVS
ncbi:MAG: carbohydrate kinase family protein [Thermomicrobiales bacterium]